MRLTVGPNDPIDSELPVAWLQPNGSAIMADTLTEVVASIVDGYDDAGDEDALAARHDALVAIATDAQVVLLDDVDLASLSELELTMVSTDKDILVTGAWTGPVPLLLIATSYEPYTGSPVPDGEVVLLDPYTERTFLDSLVKLGLGELMVRP